MTPMDEKTYKETYNMLRKSLALSMVKKMHRLTPK
jgi:hypothetical protein